LNVLHSDITMLAQQYLLEFFIIFLVGTLGGKIASKIDLPDVAVYMLIGILLGPFGVSILHIKSDSLGYQIILLFGAAFILFHGGLITSFRVLRSVWISITMLSTVGVLVTSFIVAIAAWFVFKIPFISALLLGSILSSTDPAALVPIFQKFPIRRKVAQTVITESAFTDATGAIMTTVVLSIMLSQSATHSLSIVMQFFQLSAGGLIIGLAVGIVAAFFISEHERQLLREYSPMVVVLAILAAYLIAESLHASGFMAVFTAGLVLGNAYAFRINILAKEGHNIHQFIDAIGLKLRMLIFVLLGSQIDFNVLKQYGLKSLLVVVVFIIIARPATVLVSLLPDRKARWTRKEILFLFWTRETGVIAAALTGIITSSHIAEGSLISSVVFIAILTTILLQASTTPFVARKLDLLEQKKPRTK
jgi:cell volume regulation protein A